jgi:hypothetical protein
MIVDNQETTCIHIRKGDKGVGKIKVELAKEWLGAGRPQERTSAKLSTEGTYKDKIHSLYFERSKVILCSELDSATCPLG